MHIKFEMNSSRIAVLNVSLQERCLKDQTAGPTTRDSDLGSLGGAQEFVCLNQFPGDVDAAASGTTL